MHTHAIMFYYKYLYFVLPSGIQFSSSGDGTARVWDMRRWQCTRVLRGTYRRVRTMVRVRARYILIAILSLTLTAPLTYRTLTLILILTLPSSSHHHHRLSLSGLVIAGIVVHSSKSPATKKKENRKTKTKINFRVQVDDCDDYCAATAKRADQRRNHATSADLWAAASSSPAYEAGRLGQT